jgi:hypothetical protein
MPPLVLSYSARTFATVNMRAEFETNRWQKKRLDTGTENPATCDILSRLTSRQLQSVVTSWESTVAPSDERRNGIHRFMMFAGNINPQASLELMLQLRAERGDKGVPGDAATALNSWFQKDPAALLRWSQKNKESGAFGRECEMWADAAAVVLEPTTEHITKFLPHKSYSASVAAGAIARQLPNYESRLAFFKSYHAATGGKSDDIGTFVWAMTQKIPFPEIAKLADESPAFRPTVLERKDSEGEMQSLGSLRFNVARLSRDGTPEQRWNWLVKTANDRPAGKQLAYLLTSWCERDYSDVAVWARQLAPGAERDEIRKAIYAFVKEDQRMRPKGDGKDRAAEWEIK